MKTNKLLASFLLVLVCFVYIKSQILYKIFQGNNKRFEDETEDKPKLDKRVFHIHRKNFILTPVIGRKSLCESSCNKSFYPKKTMIIFIKSSAINLDRRERIRRTWGSIRETQWWKYEFVFVVGNSNYSLVALESSKYKDILMYDGPDDYKNISMKTLASIQYSHDHLADGNYFSTADDDFLVDMASLEEAMEYTLLFNPTFVFLCVYQVLMSGNVVRDPADKYFVPRSEYEWQYYPKSCLGGFYTSKVSWVKKIWRFSADQPAVRMDDVWVTGILRQKLGVPPYAVAQTYGKPAFHFNSMYDQELTESQRLESINMYNSYWDKFLKQVKFRSHCVCLKV